MVGDSHYKAVPISADSTTILTGSRIGGFIPTAAGTWTFTLVLQNGQIVVLPGITVAAGNVGTLVEMPIFIGTVARSSLTTSSGGAGILLTA